MSINKDAWSALSMKERADLMNMYITNGISELKEMKKHYNGIPYRDLNTSDYDYFNASPEMTPTEEGQHWDSRNPHTGRLLKGENHPTFDLMVEGENKAGYKIVRGYNDELYSIPNTPDNYVEKYNSFSGEEDTDKKPIFDPEKIIRNVPAREFGPQKVMGENDFLVGPGTNIIAAPIQYWADKSTGEQNIEMAQQIISDFDAREDKQKHIDENSDYYKSYMDAKYYLDHVEALKKYLGLPYDTNLIEESDYKPTRLQGTNEKTYKFSNQKDPKYWELVIEDMVNWEQKEHQYVDPILNTFTAYRDRDDKGDFISIYDEWDYNLATKGGPKVLNKPIDKTTGGKPFVVYDRIYLDDYYAIPEEFRGNPYITPAVLTDTNAYMETSYKNGGKLTKKCK